MRENEKKYRQNWKNIVPHNFKNYHIYIKKWNKSKNAEKGECSFCLKHKKISNETCYKCYQKAYDKNVNYEASINDLPKVDKTKISKKYLSTTAVGFLIGSAIVAIPTLSITIPLFNTSAKIRDAKDEEKSKPNQQTISTLKTTKKVELNNINKTNNLIAGATIANENQLLNDLTNAKTKGDEEIEAATTIEKINNAFTTNQALANAARNAYDNAIEEANNKKQKDNNLALSKQEAKESLENHYNSKNPILLISGEINKDIKENWENALVSALNKIKDINEIISIQKIKDEEFLKIDNAFEQYQKNISFLNYLNKMNSQNTTKSNTYASSLIDDTNQSLLGISIDAEFQIIKDKLIFIGKTYDNKNGTLLVELFYKINEDVILSGQMTIIGYEKTSMKVNSFNFIPENKALLRVHQTRPEVIKSWTFNFYNDKNKLIYTYEPGVITSDREIIQNTNYKGHIKRITVISSASRQYKKQTTHVARLKFFDGIKMWIFSIDKNENVKDAPEISYNRVNQSFDLNQ